MFAIPTGIFGAGFEDMIQHRKKKEGQTASDQGDSDDDDGAMGYLPSALSAAFGGRGGGDDEPWFSFLDTRTTRGRAYRSLLLAVVVVDVLAFFASTLDSLQVRWCSRSGGWRCL